MLRAADRDHYWEHGFALLRGLVDPGVLAPLEARFVEIASGRAPAPAGSVVMRDVMVVRGEVTPATPVHGINKLLSFEEDPILFAYARDERLLAAARALIGPRVMTISTNLFNKPPGVDGRHPLHQDLRYFTLRPAEKIVATWTAISPCTRKNGCLAVIPGSHRGPLRRHGDKVVTISIRTVARVET